MKKVKYQNKFRAMLAPYTVNFDSSTKQFEQLIKMFFSLSSRAHYWELNKVESKLIPM